MSWCNWHLWGLVGAKNRALRERHSNWVHGNPRGNMSVGVVPNEDVIRGKLASHESLWPGVLCMSLKQMGNWGPKQAQAAWSSCIYHRPNLKRICIPSFLSPVLEAKLLWRKAWPRGSQQLDFIFFQGYNLYFFKGKLITGSCFIFHPVIFGHSYICTS